MFKTEKERERAEVLMRKFLAACALGWRRSRKGSLPEWVGELVPGELGGGVDLKSVPVTVRGYSGGVISEWEVGGDVVLENRAWAALLRLRPLREFWTLELRENHRVQLGKLLAETWVVDPTPVPPHGVIPGLGIQRWGDAPRELEDGRGLALFLPDSESAERVESGIVWGPDAGEDEWRAALERAGEAFSKGKGKVATVQALLGRPERAVRWNAIF